MIFPQRPAGRLPRVVSAAVALTGLALTVLSGPGLATNSEPGPRMTSAGGINLVPTPKGLGLGAIEEKLESSCAIGAGCAARTWERLIGSDANNPDAVITMQSNVGFLPTLRLAQRDQLAVAATFRTFKANGAFAGTVALGQSHGRTVLVVSGRFDQSLDDHVRLVQVRSGTRTVLISVNLDNRNVERVLPREASIANLRAKAFAVFRQSWRQVPTTVLP